MFLEFPAELSWAWLLLPLALLFLLRRPPLQRRVPNLSLFRRLSGSPALPRAKRLRTWLAFLLAATTLLLVVLALARPSPEAARRTGDTPGTQGSNRLQFAPPSPTRALRVLWIRRSRDRDPFTALALQALAADGLIEAFEADAAAPPRFEQAFDVHLLDSWLPAAWPADVPVLVLNPPHSLGQLQLAPISGGGLKVEHLQGIDATHPLLSGVASERLSLQQTAVVAAGPSLEALWSGPQGPLLLAGQVRGRRVVVLPIAPDRSARLGVLGAYPTLLDNAFRWLTGPHARVAGAPDEAQTLDPLPGIHPTDLTTPQSGGPVVSTFLCLALLLLAAQAWLYHRRAID